MYVLYLFFFSNSYFFLSFLPPLLHVVCTLWIQLNDLLSKYISRASFARVDTFVSISFHRLICYKITFSCLINFYALKHTHTYTHSFSLSQTHTDGYSKLSLVLILLFVFGKYFLSLSLAVYFPDMRNMRAWRNFPIDFHGLLHTFSTIFFDFVSVFLYSTNISGGWHNWTVSQVGSEAEIWRCCLCLCLWCCTQRGLLFAFRL